MRYLQSGAPKKVYEAGVEVWAGSIWNWNSVPPDLVLDLTGEAQARLVRAPDFPDLETVGPKVVAVAWPDMGVVPLPRTWWERLAQVMKGFGRVYVGCAAGKGRTGTALAILGYLHGAVPPSKDPVKWVREVYDPEAVETLAQQEYVAQITGVKEALPSPRFNEGFFAWPKARSRRGKREEGGERVYEELKETLEFLEKVDFTIEGDYLVLEAGKDTLWVKGVGPHFWEVEGLLLPKAEARRRVEAWVWEKEVAME